MHRSALVATAHALVSLAVTGWIALTARHQVRVIYAVGYVAASEVLWRMTSAAVPWEVGKYAVAGAVLISISRHKPPGWNWAGIAYFLLLLPSTLLTCSQITEVSRLRAIISDGLSGPLSLMVCALGLYKVRLSAWQAGRLTLLMLGPLTGVAGICSYSTARLGPDYEFGNESNFDVTGGFGPNQVSTMLGLGILVAFLWIQFQQKGVVQRLIGIGAILYLSAMSALTFSRTGVWVGAVTILAASIYVVRDRQQFLSGVAMLGVLGVVGSFIVYPVLDSFTGGKLSARFEETGFSRRDSIAKGDIQLGLRYPVFGVGLGMAKDARNREFGVSGAAHTEFTRLIAEHGMLGVLSIGALIWMGFQTLKGHCSKLSQAWSFALLAYCGCFMLASGMRLAAPAVALGLAMLRLEAPRIRRTRCGLQPLKQVSTFDHT